MNLCKGDIVQWSNNYREEDNTISGGKIVGFIFCPPEDFTTVVVECGHVDIIGKYRLLSKKTRRRLQCLWIDPKDVRVVRRNSYK